MKRKIIIWGILVVFLLIAMCGNASGQGQDPHYISGQVTDADGDAVSGATIIIERTSTDETNLKNADGTSKTDTSDPPKITITTNSNGTYLFELLNMGGFADGNEFKITATKGDDTGSVKIDIDLDSPPGYDDADIELGEEEEVVSALDIGLVCPVIIFIVFCVVVVMLLTKRKHVGNKQ